MNRLLPLVLASLVACLYAQMNTGQSIVPLYISDFSGGVNTYESPQRIKLEQFTSVSNFDIVNGTLSTRKKLFKWSSITGRAAGTPVYEAYVFYPVNGTEYYVVHCGSGVFYSTDKLTWSIILDGKNTNKPFAFGTWDNLLWMMNPVDGAFTWDQATVSTYSYIPGGEQMLWAGERMYVIGMAGKPNAIRYSVAGKNLTLEASWPRVNEVYINQDDGDCLTAMAQRSEDVLLFKRQAMFAMSVGAKSNDVAWKMVGHEVGCVDRRSIQKRNNMWYFLSTEGYYATNGYSVTPVGHNVYNELKGTNQAVNSASVWRVWSVADVARGTLENCSNNGGLIQLSTFTKIWDTETEFAAGTLKGATLKDGMVVIGTASVPVYQLIPYAPEATFNGVGGSFEDIQNLNDATNQNAAVLKDIDGAYATQTDERLVSPSLFYKLLNGSDQCTLMLNMEQKYHVALVSWTYESKPTAAETVYHVRISYKDAGDNWVLVNNNTYEPTIYRLHETDTPNSIVGMFNTYDDYEKIVRCNKLLDMQGYSPWMVHHWSGLYNMEAYTKNIKIDISRKPGWLDRYSDQSLTIYELELYGSANDDVYVGFSTYTSNWYDTTISSPVYGDFEAVVSTEGDSGYRFYARTSPDGINGTTWYALAQSTYSIGISTNLSTVIPRSRYIQWKANLLSPTSTYCTSIHSVAWEVQAETGSWTSEYKNTRQVGYWGNFAVSQNADGQTISWLFRSSDTAAHCASETLASITPGDAVPASTNNVVINLKALLSSTNAAKRPQIESMEVNWYKTGKFSSCASSIINDKILLSVSTGTSATNNIVYATAGNGNFTTYDYKIGCMAKAMDGKVYAGAPDAAKFYELEYDTSSDDGTTTATYLETGVIDLHEQGGADLDKQLYAISLYGKTNTSGQIVYVGWCDGYTTAWSSAPLYFTTDYTCKYFKPPQMLKKKSFKVKVFTQDQHNVSISGLGIDLNVDTQKKE